MHEAGDAGWSTYCVTPSGAAAAGSTSFSFRVADSAPGGDDLRHPWRADRASALVPRGAFTLWHPESNLGEFQNQAYGYLFPQGTWSVLGPAGRPDWVSQRLWSALVLVVACEGARRVARAVGLPGPAALVAARVRVLARLLGTVPVITGESLPGAVMPWVVLPVLLRLNGRGATDGGGAQRRGRRLHGRRQRSGERRLAAARRRISSSGGSAEGSPIRFAAAVGRGRGGRVAVVGAAAPGARGLRPPFYEYVESASNTTALIGWSEAVRGDSHWVAYLVTGDRAWWPAAYFLVSEPVLIIVAAVVAAIGLVGLTRLDTRLRTPAGVCRSFGLAALTIAHGGWEGSPLAGRSGGCSTARSRSSATCTRSTRSSGCRSRSGSAAPWPAGSRGRSSAPASLSTCRHRSLVLPALAGAHPRAAVPGQQRADPGLGRDPRRRGRTRRTTSPSTRTARTTLVVPGLRLRPAGLGLDDGRAPARPRGRRLRHPQPGPADPGGVDPVPDALDQLIVHGPGDAASSARSWPAPASATSSSVAT